MTKESVKEKLFSVTRDDCRWDTFRAGGPGGQNQNKVETGVRCTHLRSGAIGESREHNSQWANKQAAMRRMSETNAFKAWVKMEAARRLGQPSVSWTDGVDVSRIIGLLSSAPESEWLVEVKDFTGRWVTLTD